MRFNFLLVQYGIAVNYVGLNSNATWATNGYNNIQTNPIYTTRSGYFVSGDDGAGSFLSQASGGHLWSGTIYSGTYAYDLGYDSSLVVPADINYRQSGYPVRCIAKHFYYGFLKAGPKVI